MNRKIISVTMSAALFAGTFIQTGYAAGEAPAYSAPLTLWDFNDYSPSEQPAVNVPYISGTAVYDSGEIKMVSDTKNTSSSVSLNFETPIENNMRFSFDFTGHAKHLSGQYIQYKITNSEGEIVASMDCDAYNSVGTGITIFGA